VLLQRTRAEQVVPVYRAFAERYPEAEFLAREKPADLLGVIGSLGLHWRVPLMIKMAERIRTVGSPPDRLDDLVELPGVGPYAASAYLSLHRGKRAVIVDANVVRCLGRVFGFATGPETRRKAWLLALADRLTPRRNYRDYNYAVLDLAMKVCVGKPKCAECPLAKRLCVYAAKTGAIRTTDYAQRSERSPRRR